MAFLRCPQCSLKCGTHYVPYDVLRLLRMGFRRLEYSESKSLLKKYLTREMLEYLKFRRTVNNVNLYDCIKCGLEVQDNPIGIFACDPESYFVFSPIFFPILEELHGFSADDVHPKSLWLPLQSIPNLESKRKFVKLSRIRVARNLKGYPFTSRMTVEQFERVEEFLVMILELMTGDFDGTYEKIGELTDDRQKYLTQKSILFDNKNKYLEAGGAYRHWPHGRGVFINTTENFIVWINPHDHIKIISTERGGNLRRIFERTMRAVRILNRDLNFIKSKRMGYVTFCPSDMGTGLKASMHLLLPNLAKDYNSLVEKAEEMDVKLKRIGGQEEIFEISNKTRLGITEIDCVTILEQAVLSLIALEEAS